MSQGLCSHCHGVPIMPMCKLFSGDRCKFGPFTFGGGRNYPLMAPGERNASRTSVRQFLQGRKRERIGGSTTHMDGERCIHVGFRGSLQVLVPDISLMQSIKHIYLNGCRHLHPRGYTSCTVPAIS